MFGGFWWLLAVAAAVWVIYDVFTVQKRLKTELKIMWTVLAVLFNIITAIVYYFVVKRK